jgi:DNA-binding Lrp family transcriptional regulator
MREKILEFMENKTYRPMTLEDLAIALNENEKELLFELEKLEADYIIKRTKKKKYDLMSRFNLFVGKLKKKVMDLFVVMSLLPSFMFRRN